MRVYGVVWHVCSMGWGRGGGDGGECVCGACVYVV